MAYVHFEMDGGNKFLHFFFLAQQPNSGHGRLILEVSRSRAMTNHILQDFSVRVNASSERPLPDNTQHLQKISMPRAGVESAVPRSERPQT